MKKKLFCLLSACIFMLSGCNLNEDFSDKYVYTTFYPIEYATNILYGTKSKISSVYPDNATTDYGVTDKKKKIYSNGEIFIYSGIAKEANLAKDLLNANSNLKLIDATKGMDNNLNITNIWLDPSNYLMLCSNIKSSLIEYNDNVYTKEEIENNYKTLNEKVSEIDVKLYDIGKNGNYNTILATSDVFNYLTKYNINVISIDKNTESIDKSYAEATSLIKSKKIEYIYVLENEKLTEEQEKFISSNSLTKVTINDMYTLTDEERKEEKDYITLMDEIIDNYKKELYKK